ncbi:MAG: hypothetical protein DCC75_06230 [Proteobacteria bacterium]|nr:MAG: hypothetical protein DCC75_06230 [Pseudomonadota bacterium]
MIIAIIAALVSAGLIFAGLVYVKKQVTSSGGAERESLIEKIPSELEKLQQVLTRAENYASKGQLEFLVKQLDSINEELNKEKGALQGIESQGDFREASTDLFGSNNSRAEIG